MANLSLTFTDRGIQEYLRGRIRRSADLTPAFAEIGELLLRKTRDRFDQEIAPDGTRWARLRPSTIKAKSSARGKRRSKKSKAAGSASPFAILKDTYLLRDTITYEVYPRGLRIGSPQNYGVYHQLGTPIMAARPYLGLDLSDYEAIEEILARYLAL